MLRIKRIIFDNRMAVMGVRSISMLLSYLVVFVIARNFTSSSVGEYLYWLNLITILPVVYSLGIPTLIIKEGAKYLRGSNDLEVLIQKSGGSIVQVSLIFSFVTAIFLYLRIGWSNNVYFFVAVLPFLSTNQLIVEVLRLREKFLISELIRTAFLPLLVLIMLCLFFSLSIDYVSPVNILKIAVVFYIFLASQIFIRYVEFKEWSVSNIFRLDQDIFRKSLPYLVVILVSFLGDRISILLLSIVEDHRTQALYSIPLKIVGLSSFFNYAINITLAPRLSRLYEDERTDEIGRLIRGNITISFVLTLLLSVFISVFAEEILGFFGDEYVLSIEVVYFLCFVYCFHAFTGPSAMYLSMTGGIKPLNLFLVAGALVNIAVIYLLSPSMGAMSAAMALGASFLLWKTSAFIYIVVRDGLLFLPSMTVFNRFRTSHGA